MQEYRNVGQIRGIMQYMINSVMQDDNYKQGQLRVSTLLSVQCRRKRRVWLFSTTAIEVLFLALNIRPLPKWSFYLPHPGICSKTVKQHIYVKIISIKPLSDLAFNFSVLRDHICRSKKYFFQYSRVIHQKKRLLSLIVMQKSVLQNIVKCR